MGLYLCIYDEHDAEVDGVEVGSYADFSAFREAVCGLLEGGHCGSRFPILMTHQDSDGEWPWQTAAELRAEFTQIQLELARLPPRPVTDGWQREVARAFRLTPKNLAECFFDVDGTPLLERLISLAETCTSRRLPILFQ